MDKDEIKDEIFDFQDEQPRTRPSNFTENELDEAAEAASTGKSSVKKFFVFGGILIGALLIVGFYMFGGSSSVKDKRATLSVSSTPAANITNDALESQIRDLKNQLNSNSAVNPAAPTGTNPNPIMTEPLTMPQTVAEQPIYNVNPLATPSPSGAAQSTSSNNSERISSYSNDTTTKNSTVSTSRSSSEENSSTYPMTNSSTYPMTNSRNSGPNPQKSVYLGNPSENSNVNSNIRVITPTSFVQDSLRKPPFNTVLPVRFLGAAHSLATSAMVRMELVRAIRGNGYYLPRGTILVGQISGNQYNRLFVSVNGYIDSASNQLISLRGDVLGDDGAVGVVGERQRLNSRWRKVLGQVLNGAKELGSAYLLGRRGGSGGINFGGGLGQIGQGGLTALDAQNNAEFVMIRAGAFGYVLVNDLPPLMSVESAPVEDESLLGTNNGQKPLTNEEMVALLTQGDETAVRREYGRMSPSMRILADKMLAGK